MTAEMIVAIVLPAIGGLVWLVRLEGRVNTTEAILRGMKDDMTYIRNRIDQALNGHE